MKILGSKIFYICKIFCLIFFVVPAVFADDFHYINTLVGNRASGLGGAYTAISDDPAGCYYNPAGIAFSPHTNLSASVNAFTTSTKIYKDALMDVNGNTIDWKQESSSLLPNYFGIVRKLGPGKLGISYAVPDSIQRRQKQIFNNISSYIPDNSITTYSININDNDKTYYFGPSYAIAFSDSLTIGATIYAYYRDMEIIRNQLLLFEQGQHYLINFYETKKDWGYKPILGAIWEPIDKLAVGISVSKLFISTSDNDQQVIFRDTSADSVYVIGSSAYDFSDTNAIFFGKSNNNDKNKFPFTASLGLAYFASSKLLLSGDIRYYESVSDNDSGTEKEAIFNYALGTEYYFSDQFAVRAGFFTDMANTPQLSTNKTNQQEHVDIYGGSLSFTTFQRTSSITLGFSYGLGRGEAQVVANSTAIQDVEIDNLYVYISASYSY